ncbi:hypothetical protein [Actinomadura sp. 9N407]|uniref:hypothetical protein n=1 Tax=Actinomadura sp. 9N407 TaxID=3375154 RepID=UPI0037A7FF17
MVHELLPYSLTWDEVDPQRHPFDAVRAAEVVAGLGPASRVPSRPAGPAADSTVIAWSHQAGQAWVEEMTRALAERYGRWALGWRWALDEGGLGGGPVGSWCCPRDSITTPAETLTRVVASLVEWRDWLEDLAERFERFPLDIGGPEEDRRLVWERGAAHLVTVVVDRTGAGDAWYGHCRLVLTWFLTRWDVPRHRAAQLVDEAIDGRFESWIEPSRVAVADVAERLAESLTESLSESLSEPLADEA